MGHHARHTEVELEFRAFGDQVEIRFHLMYRIRVPLCALMSNMCPVTRVCRLPPVVFSVLPYRFGCEIRLCAFVRPRVPCVPCVSRLPR
jgi:hypothetical protein